MTSGPSILMKQILSISWTNLGSMLHNTPGPHLMDQWHSRVLGGVGWWPMVGPAPLATWMAFCSVLPILSMQAQLFKYMWNQVESKHKMLFLAWFYAFYNSLLMAKDGVKSCQHVASHQKPTIWFNWAQVFEQMTDYFLRCFTNTLSPNLFPYAKNVNLSLKGAMAAENVPHLFKPPMTCLWRIFESVGSFEFFTGCTIS